MVRDSPKAIHFIALKNGVELDWQNHEGLRVRWQFAQSVRIHRLCMFRLTDDQRQLLLNAIDEFNAARNPETDILIGLAP